MTQEGIAAFGTQWKNMDAKIVEGPAMPGAGAKWKTAYDIQPHAGESGFDDSSWPTIEAKALDERRGGAPSTRAVVTGGGTTRPTARASTCGAAS